MQIEKHEVEGGAVVPRSMSPLAHPLEQTPDAEATPQNSALLRDESRDRVKSSLRIKYESEAEAIRRKIGDLETIRKQLGLSQRKICQLLLVDPSAWTRWTSPGNSAPPHVYRSLSWLLALSEKYPALDVNFWLNTVSKSGIEDRVEARLKKESQSIRELVHNATSRIATELTDFVDIRAELQLKNLSRTLSYGILILIGLFVAFEFFFRLFRPTPL